MMKTLMHPLSFFFLLNVIIAQLLQNRFFSVINIPRLSRHENINKVLLNKRKNFEVLKPSLSELWRAKAVH
ncbi:unnamed protein product [Trifolium pratense]|uniref:Uncharacterized protein n=1 Tax=Trifolium pratense TaxID=57577 RepID=A0ACB0L3R8_TRIPR|nr:unnamed protein product [Trifolium pratense]